MLEELDKQRISNRPELTAERFLSDPFSDDPGQRLYKTGDRVQLLPNGDLEYLDASISR